MSYMTKTNTITTNEEITMLVGDEYHFIMKQDSGTEISVEGCKAQLPDIFSDFTQWLLGCTFTQEMIDDMCRDYLGLNKDKDD